MSLYADSRPAVPMFVPLILYLCFCSSYFVPPLTISCRPQLEGVTLRSNLWLVGLRSIMIKCWI